jgi:hypothetical protein
MMSKAEQNARAYAKTRTLREKLYSTREVREFILQAYFTGYIAAGGSRDEEILNPVLSESERQAIAASMIPDESIPGNANPLKTNWYIANAH